MTNPKSRVYAAVAGALSLSAAAAWAAEPTQAELRIKELEQKVAALEAQQSSSKDLSATVDSVLRDAEKRSQLLATSGDMSAGYDNGFFIRAGDNWVLRPGAQLQFRYVANWREDVAQGGGTTDDEIESGFEVARMKLMLEGTAVTRDLTYLFQWETDSEGGGMFLEDAWARWMFSDQWGVRMGQFKDPVHHEELTRSGRQLAVDRSLVNELLGGGVTGWTQGASLIYGGYAKDNPVNVEVALTDGLGEQNTNFTDHRFDFGVAGRFEYKAMGDWRSYRDFTAAGNKEDLLVIGVGGDWSQSGDGDVFLGTVDVQYENSGGLGVYGAVLVDNVDEQFTGGDSTTDWGALVQAGYLLNPSVELFGRYDIASFDQNQTTDEDTFHEITVGMNYFLGTDGSALHRAKFTVDVSWLPNGSPRAISGIGVLDNNDAGNEIVIRGQFQLLI